MRKTLLAIFALPLALAACELTPLQQCQAPYRAQLRTVTEETRTTEQNLSRGYRLVPTRFAFGLHYCLDHFGHATLCRAEEGEPMYDKRPINRAAERAKLNALIAERKRLDAALSHCALQFPA